MVRLSLAELIKKFSRKPKQPFPMLVETASANEKAKKMKFENLPAEARAIFWETVAEQMASPGIIKTPGRTTPKPSPLKEVDVASEDATPKVFDDVAEFLNKQRGKKFLVNSSPRRNANGEDEASTVYTAEG